MLSPARLCSTSLVAGINPEVKVGGRKHNSPVYIDDLQIELVFIGEIFCNALGICIKILITAI